MIELGREVKDIVSGFKGVSVGRSVYLNGCAHICIQPKVNKDGTLPKDKWFDEPQIEYVGTKKTKRGSSKVGGPSNYSRSR